MSVAADAPRGAGPVTVGSGRPSVTVIVPFAGAEGDLDRLLDRLARVTARPGDEFVVVDNRQVAKAVKSNQSADRSGELATSQEQGMTQASLRVIQAGGIASPGFARNRGAAAAHTPWLVFLDADVTPSPGLLDAYFEPPPDPSTAVLAGGIRDAVDAGDDAVPTRVARHVIARKQMADATTAARAHFPYAQTANAAFRHSAFVAAGGFDEHVRAGEDADLCFRLAADGWGLERRPAAVARHHPRAGLVALLVQLARHGAGAAWCERRHPGSFPGPGAAALSRRLAAVLRRGLGDRLRGDRRAPLRAGLEMLEALAFEMGRRLPNRTRRRLRV